MKSIFLWVTLLAPTLWAQNDMTANVNMQFRFDNPGARARAMGGAFIGLADDATALFANPAGLTQMASNSIVLEASHTDRDDRIPFYGGQIVRTNLQDFDFRLEERNFANSVTSIPFLAYVHTKHKVKWGVFYAEQANFEREFQTAGVAIPPYQGPTYTSTNPLFFFNPSQNDIEFTMRSLGVSFATNLGERLSVGITLNYHDFGYEGNTTLLIPDFEQLFPDLNFSPTFIEQIRPFIGRPFAIIDVDGDDNAFSAYGGFLLRLNERFSLGVAYKQQPEWTYGYATQATNNSFELQDPQTGDSDFNVPDSFGVGISFKPTDTFLFSLDVNRVLYSDLVDPYQQFFETSNDPTGATQTIDDTTEYRAGFEYFITSTRFPIALRAGYWFEPYHALKNTNLDGQTVFAFTDNNGDFIPAFRSNSFLQQFERDQNHLTFGFGITLGSNWVMDLAADLADESNQFSLSGIYRLP